MEVSDLERRLSADSPEVASLRARSVDLVQLVSGRLADGGEAIPLIGIAARNAELRTLMPTVRRQVLIMQTEYAYDPEDPGLMLSRLLGERGIEVRLATRPSVPRTHPLLSSIHPRTLLGPVFVRAMVIDDHTAVVGGPDDAFGNRISWRTSDGEVVQRLHRLWNDTLELSEPLLPPQERAPLSDRQLEVARLLCVGEKDKAIARLLGLSARTVEREVSILLRVLGASSRTEAVLLMRGRGVNSGSSRS